MPTFFFWLLSSLFHMINSRVGEIILLCLLVHNTSFSTSFDVLICLSDVLGYLLGTVNVFCFLCHFWCSLVLHLFFLCPIVQCIQVVQHVISFTCFSFLFYCFGVSWNPVMSIYMICSEFISLHFCYVFWPERLSDNLNNIFVV